MEFNVLLRSGLTLDCRWLYQSQKFCRKRPFECIIKRCPHKSPEAWQVSLVWVEIFDSICGASVLAAIEEGDTVGTIVALGRFNCVVQECIRFSNLL